VSRTTRSPQSGAGAILGPLHGALICESEGLLPHSESTFPQSRKILAEILAGVPEDEQAKIAGGNAARLYGFDAAGLTPR